MTDRKKKTSGARHTKSREATQGDSSTRGGGARRGGFGDDQGTRIGSPSPSGREHTGPSSRPVNEGLEGAIFDEDEQES
jgi:hypothetical protein